MKPLKLQIRTSRLFCIRQCKPTEIGQTNYLFSLSGYRTSIRMSTRATQYSLVYGIPIELEVPSLRIMAKCQIAKADWQQNRFKELMLFDERRLKA